PCCRPRYDPIEDSQHMAPLIVAEAVRSSGIVPDSFSDHNAVGFLQTRRSPPEDFYGCFIKGKRHLDHIGAILPYCRQGRCTAERCKEGSQRLSDVVSDTPGKGTSEFSWHPSWGARAR